MILNRETLQLRLEAIAGEGHVFFQPPPSLKLSYPAIVYSLSDIMNTHADGTVYRQNRMYSVIVIDKDPDSEISDAVSMLPEANFDRWYAADNLNHFVYTIYTMK